MLKKRYFLVCIFFATLASAQFHEIGVFLGGSNYVGDVGTHRYLDPNSFAYGILYKWNITDRYSLRGSFNLTNLKENEYRNNDLNRFSRSYKVDNSLEEFSAGIEINFSEFNLHAPELSFTPYVFYGLSYFRYDQFYLTPNGPFDPPTYNNYGKAQKVAIPLNVGFKINPNPFFVLGLEVGVRYTFTDNLDGSQPGEKQKSSSYYFGSTLSKDWYVFSGISITYLFGKKNCYCPN